MATDLLFDMQPERTNECKEIYKEQLQLLIQDISYRNVHFSAGGIFEVNFKVISMLVSVVATYLIVVLQFR